MENNLLKIKGLGEKKSNNLKKMNIGNIEQLLYFFPRKYEDRRRLYLLKDAAKLGDKKCTVKLRIVANASVKKLGIKKSIIKFCAFDGKNYCDLIFFNRDYLSKSLYDGAWIYVYGVCKTKGSLYEFVNPEIDRLKNYSKLGKIMPIYPLSKGITNNDMVKFIKIALEMNYNKIFDIIPKNILKSYNLLHRVEAIRELHFPKNPDMYSIAKKTIAVEKLLVFQLGIKLIKCKLNQAETDIYIDKKDFSKTLIKSLAFELTAAQKRVIDEINVDLSSVKPMNRLVQGDVGSGKTLVAFSAILNTVNSGYQANFMAPTEILAVQHYENFNKYLQEADISINIALLTGSTTAKNKRTILEELSKGQIDVLIGTHALIEDNIVFSNLGLSVTDEQHRFGVRQRARLSKKGNAVNVLVMTATPIPRTLSLIVYGDLDVSIIDEMPPNRQRIITEVSSMNNISNVMKFIRKEVEKGRQAYIVTPLIENSEDMDLASAEEIYESLKSGYFSDKKICLLHGKLKPKEKDKIMQKFYEGEIDVLISTTVIEVGVDVPNATIMTIINAERFGLAQIHQLRGRVGRGKFQSYCILISERKSENSRKRMDILKNSSDGFEIAEEDLKIRGPGQYFGTRQHGVECYGIEELCTDVKLLAETSIMVEDILNDPEFYVSEEYVEIRQAVKRLFINEEIIMN